MNLAADSILAARRYDKQDSLECYPKTEQVHFVQAGRNPAVFTPPPPTSAEFRSTDLAAIHEFIAAFDGTHRRLLLERRPLRYCVRALRCGAVDLGWTSTQTRQRIQGTPRDAILHIPLGRRHVYSVGSRTFEASPDTAILHPPGQEYALYFEPGDCLLSVRVPRTALESELQNREPNTLLATREISLSRGRRERLAALHQWLVAAAGPTLSDANAVAKQAEGLLVSWLAEQVLGSRTARSGRSVSEARVRDVEEWIEAHLAEPITVGRLCAVAGVGDRYLESAFVLHRGQPPLQFVLRRRLARARRHLLDAKPGDNVTRLAHDAGFVHLGRFAARYGSAYRESPSVTLRRSLDLP